ncbi:SHOCT domain-containing protein [Gordonia liuliyuniae]|uniref:SHOCT domain-containing protein n=1 Tax=Gordonia liuliyuniae TaxID=2911517 RepID=A0ABS9IPP2_9ACTN|nr:SHOCT domain-containing protein [Gordonia liuliyuniae]MCF8587494.1 SHOCT domain-containing protein [Gordonia liuliyuniae]
MMLRRGGRPGLIGLAARTAVVAGTANAVNSRQAQRAVDRMAPEPAPIYQSPSSASPASDLTGELTRLADLRSQGLLTDDEFAAAKAKLLN